MTKPLEEILSNKTINKAIEMAHAMGSKDNDNYILNLNRYEIILDENEDTLKIKSNESYLEFNGIGSYQRNETNDKLMIKSYDNNYAKIIEDINRLYKYYERAKSMFKL